MFTLVAYQEAKPADDVPIAIAAVPDQHVRTDGSVIYMADINEVIGVYAGGHSTIEDAYLASPSLRRLANYAIGPIALQALPLVLDSFMMHPESPLPLEKNEGLEAIIEASATVGAVFTTVGVLLADGPVTPISGEIFHVRATCPALTAAALAWQNRELTFDDTLPVGRYQIVGAKCFGPTVVLFRFVPIGEAHRPGGLGSNLLGIKTIDLQRNGGLGVWCEFDQITPPSVDFLKGIAAGTDALALHVDLIKIS